MSIICDPASQLLFKRPLTIASKEILIIKNPNNSPVAFKVKTTSPKQYCVRPNSGRIEPSEQVEIEVLLQPMTEEPPADFKSKDKFLVQSILITDDKADIPPTQIWTLLEDKDKALIKERKLRCLFSNLDDVAGAEINGTDTSMDNEAPASKSGKARSIRSQRSMQFNEHFGDKEKAAEPNVNNEAVMALKNELSLTKSRIAQLETDKETLEKVDLANKIRNKLDDPLSNPVAAPQMIAGMALVAFLAGAWLF